MKRFAKDLLLSARMKWRDFGNNDSGSILQMTGLSIIPLMLAAGVAIDTSRINFAHQKLAAGLDAGALAAGTLVNKPQAAMEAVANSYLNTNFLNGDSITIQSSTLTDGGKTLTFEATARVPTTIMRLSGTNYVDVKLSSTVIKDGSSIEVALILDNTTSMGPYMADLKAAAIDFVDTVVQPANPPYYAKVSVVPYNRGVNLGTLANSARGTITSGTSTSPGSSKYTFTNANNSSATLDITTCVSERTGAEKYTDASVTANKVGLVYANSNNPCIQAQIQPLTADKTVLNTAINAMTAGSSTAGQVGIAWGWYTISPNNGLFTGSSLPAAYGTEKLKKVAVLMTDGEYNSAYCNGVISGNQFNSGSGGKADQINCLPSNDSSYNAANLPKASPVPQGYSASAWNTIVAKTTQNKSVYVQSKSLCAAMKAKGIEIWTIEFQLDPDYPDRTDLVSNCATDASHRVTASDGPSLKAAFAKIAATLGDPRVYK